MKLRLIYDKSDGFIMAYGIKPGVKIHPDAAVVAYDSGDYLGSDLAAKRIDLGTKKIVDKYALAATVTGDDIDIVTDCPDDLTVEYLDTPPDEPDPLPENPTPAQQQAWKAAMAQWEEDMRAWEAGKTTQKVKPAGKKAKIQLGNAPTKAGKPQDHLVTVKHRLCRTAEGGAVVTVKDKKIYKPPKPGKSGKKPTKGMAQ